MDPPLPVSKSFINEEDPMAKFEIQQELGKGSYGVVYKGIDRATKEPVAIKSIPLLQNEEESFAQIQREVSALQDCGHPNVVNYLGSYRKRDALWIVMEYCGGGSVADLIRTTDQPLDEAIIQHICAETLKGLAYLHSRGVVHRDIKCGNILLTETGEVKLADFGVAAQLSSTLSKRNTFIGTPHWMAPEVIQHSRYDGKVDVWALGISAIEMAEMQPPHFNVHPMRVIFMVSKEPAPQLQDRDKWSLTFIDFIQQALQKDWKNRPAARKLMQHRFVLRPPARAKTDLLPLVETFKQELAANQIKPMLGTLHTLRSASRTYKELLPGAMPGHEAPGVDSAWQQQTIQRVPSAQSPNYIPERRNPHQRNATDMSGSMVLHNTIEEDYGSGTVQSGSIRESGSFVQSMAGTSELYPKGSSLGGSGDDGGGGYLDAIKAMEAEEKGEKKKIVPPSTTNRLKERLWSLYNGGSVIPLPFVSASHAAPLSLLDPPGSVRRHAPGTLRPEEAEVLEELASGRAGGEDVPEYIKKQVSESPVLQNLLRSLSYHQRCMTQLPVDDQTAKEMQLLISNLSEVLRTVLCL